MSRPKLLAAISAIASLLGAAGCGNPDNLVVGGILGATNVPDATISVVGSALSGLGTVLAKDGSMQMRSVIILSDQTNLCDTLATDPQYFQQPSSEVVALVLAAPQEMVGTFYPGSQNTSATMLATAGPGQGVYAYPGLSGTVSLNSIDTSPKGHAQGQFDIQFVDTAANQYEIYGQFKTTECDALNTAFIPELVLGVQ